MKTALISDITDEEFSSAEQLVISGIKASDPKLDTRVGTALRSLLVEPEARIEAVTSKQIEYVRKSSSLKSLQEAERDGEDVDPEDLASLMSNFNLQPANGTKAYGLAKITVASGDAVCVVGEGTEFKTSDGLVFKSISSVSAAVEGYSGKARITTRLYEGAAGYFFLVPVVSAEVGGVYNVKQGTSFEISASVYTFVSAEAYKSFDGGTDVADIADTISKIPAGLSIRGFVNKNACEGLLRDAFDGGGHPIIACSTVGYGNAAQRRDKHDVFGVGVGGRIDLYVRNFEDLYTITETVVGHREYVYNDDRTEIVRVDYLLDVLPDKFPGNCWVKSVSSIYDVNSSLDFSCSRRAYGIDETWHDFNTSDDASEAFNTIWQGLNVRVLEVPADTSGESSSGQETWSETREFKVSTYCLPEAVELQNYVDRDDIRSVSTDVVVRCPIICNVSISATVVYSHDKPIDEEDAKYKIRKYINSLGFVRSLTRSEIVFILKQCGAVSVDLNKKDMLYGILHDARGKEYTLSGDSLSVEGLATADAMLTQDTTIFAVEQENIQLTLVPDK